MDFESQYRNSPVYKKRETANINLRRYSVLPAQLIGAIVCWLISSSTALDLCQSSTEKLCAQICIPIPPDSFECACKNGYNLDTTDNSSCNEPIPWLALANGYYLRNYTLDGSSSALMAKGFQNIMSLDFDYESEMLYFLDARELRIRRMKWSKENLDQEDPESETVLRHNLYGVNGIAFDWIGKKLYYLNENERSLRVCEANGSHCHTLLRNRFSKTRSIACLPQKGYCFFTEWSLSPYIGRIAMDGSTFEKIVTENLMWPTGISIDYHSEKVFWSDPQLNEINYCDLDGSNRQKLPVTRVPHVFSVVIFDDWIYWTDWNVKEISRSHKYTGENEEIIANTIQEPNQLQVIHPSRQPQMENPCGPNNGGCSHLCLLSPSGGFSCKCPDFFILNSDKKTCTANCTSNQWRCSGGDDKCIPLLWKCDGEVDCRDYSDETEERVTCPNRVCVWLDFQCRNQNCVKASKICDGNNDCGDDSDEVDCQNQGSCPRGTLRCGEDDTDCVPLLWRCDGTADCLDGSDEFLDRKTCLERHCKPGIFQCKNLACIDSKLQCNGENDCGDNSDEECTPFEFKCNSTGRCIPDRKKCNAENDCEDNSDEAAELCKNHECTEEEFTCGNDKCIPLSSVCDTEDDCGDNTDEPPSCQNRTCAHGWSPCLKSYRCFPNWAFCNGKSDCPFPDQSDEHTNRCPACDPIGDFRCEMNGKCIPRRWMCDGENDCGEWGSGSDETAPECGGTTRPCSESEFRCRDGTCLPPSQRCDNNRQCNEGEDEEGC